MWSQSDRVVMERMRRVSLGRRLGRVPRISFLELSERMRIVLLGSCRRIEAELGIPLSEVQSGVFRRLGIEARGRD